MNQLRALRLRAIGARLQLAQTENGDKVWKKPNGTLVTTGGLAVIALNKRGGAPKRNFATHESPSNSRYTLITQKKYNNKKRLQPVNAKKQSAGRSMTANRTTNNAAMRKAQQNAYNNFMRQQERSVVANYRARQRQAPVA